MKSQFLKKLWMEALEELQPRVLLRRRGIRVMPEDAVLCWGKAATVFWQSLERTSKGGPSLIISATPPEFATSGQGERYIVGDHPLPGPGSFEAGEALLDFFDSLRRLHVRRLHIFLSGGASSLAWLKPAGMTRAELQKKLEALYRAPLTIQQLNAERSKLCGLKSGGAARWLKRLAPQVQARVHLVSDVLPAGPEVVGSGPFWDRDEGIPHDVLADNRTFVEILLAKAKAAGVSVLGYSYGEEGIWSDWVSKICRAVSIMEKTKNNNASGLIVMGGEPQLKLPLSAKRNKGGRQTHIAAALSLRLQPHLASGRIELGCFSSDGVDGRSGSAGAVIDRSLGRRWSDPRVLGRLERSVERFNSATELHGLGALVPSRPSGTNVQDVVLVLVHPKSSGSRSI